MRNCEVAQRQLTLTRTVQTPPDRDRLRPPDIEQLAVEPVSLTAVLAAGIAVRRLDERREAERPGASAAVERDEVELVAVGCIAAGRALP